MPGPKPHPRKVQIAHAPALASGQERRVQKGAGHAGHRFSPVLACSGWGDFGQMNFCRGFGCPGWRVAVATRGGAAMVRATRQEGRP